MPTPLPEIMICGSGPAAREAAAVLAGLGASVAGFVLLPWETPPAEDLSAPLLRPQDLAGASSPPALLATDRPRKAGKLLRAASPQRLVLESFQEYLDLLREGLGARHPELFPPRPDPDNRRMFAYDRGLLPNRLLALFDQDVRSVRQAHEKSGLSIGYPGWNLLYYSCLCSLRPDAFNLIIETGTNVGCSTIVLAQALKDSGFRGLVRSADLDPELLATARSNLELAGLSQQVQLEQADGVAFLSSGALARGADAAISFAFLDDCHEAEHVFREFEALHPRLDQGSCVFFDNVDDPEGVAGALRRIQQRYGGNVVRFENTSWHPPGQAMWQADGLSGVKGLEGIQLPA